ncbi:MAG TPA: hypothetical protein VGR28_02865 [Candidatus Thermoplasmatota archaeon]|jgi:hypothetical protein|nr:hypothetical protein [Candidatus Thermoplasmatota archaeon]
MRALLLAGLLLAPLAASADAPLQVHVRVEGNWAHLWEGWVSLDGTYTFTAESGRVHTQDARTPLGALHAAAQLAGMALIIRDEYDDLEPVSVQGEYWWDAKWWDYRVGWVQTNYGPQQQWLDARGPLRDGDDVLWYVEQPGSTPLRVAALGPAVGPGPCVQAVLVTAPLLDPLHETGQPWPELTWRPAQLARLRSSEGASPAPAGIGVAALGGVGWAFAEEEPLPAGLWYHYVRSARLPVECLMEGPT